MPKGPWWLKPVWALSWLDPVLACPGEQPAPVTVPAAVLRELAEAVDGLAESVRLSQEDTSQQIRSGASPDFEGAYHLVWCRAMRANSAPEGPWSLPPLTPVGLTNDPG